MPNGINDQYFLLVYTDRGGHVFENIFESDNYRSGDPILVALTPPPDLQVTDVVAPLDAFSGQPMTIRWTVENLGPTATLAMQWRDRIYMSADGVLDDQDQLLRSQVVAADGFVCYAARFGSNPIDTLMEANPAAETLPVCALVGGLEPGEFYELAATFMLPVGVSGDFYFLVETDADDHVFEHVYENNNVGSDATATHINLTPPPDLEVALVDAPDTALASRELTVDYRVVNAGTTATPNWTWKDRLFLSADDVFEPDTDLLLATRGRNGSLQPDHYYDANFQVRLPDDVTGSYFVFVETDFQDVVFELNHENVGMDVQPITVQSQPADLEVQEFTVPVSAEAGQAILTRWTVGNVGAGETEVRSWHDGVYLSTDMIWDDDDQLLADWPHMTGLPLGKSYLATTLTLIPVTVAPGQYFLILRTDSEDDVFEAAEEANNVSLTQLTVTQSTADLQTNAVNTSATASSGGLLTVSWTVRNLGPGATDGNIWTDVVYLSQDQIFDPATDRYLGFFPKPRALNPGDTYQREETFEIPRGMSGPYYVFVRTDSRNQLHERGDEENNTAYDPLSMNITLLPPADLIVGSIVVPEHSLIGQPVSIDYTVDNQGTSGAEGRWFDSIYLSADDRWNIGDAFFGRVDHIGTVPGGESYSESLTAPLPGVVPGVYRVIVRSDILNRIPETDEGNNLAASLDQFSLNAPELLLETPLTDALPLSETLFFRVDVPADETLLVDFENLSGWPV